MESHVSRPDIEAPLGRRILGSFLSAAFGWLTLVVLCLVEAFIAQAISLGNSGILERLEGAVIVAVYAAAFVLCTWALVLLPLYLFTPRSSFLWRWPICTVCGAAAGTLIMFGFYGPHSVDSGAPVMIALAALVGGATCLFGSLTANRFRENHAAQPA